MTLGLYYCLIVLLLVGAIPSGLIAAAGVYASGVLR